jgi:fermentation-respiration switch protein FrsA (DUF1100 family)
VSAAPPEQRARPRARRRGFAAATALALLAAALLAVGGVVLALYPPVPADLDGAPDLDHRARRVRVPVGADSLDGWVLDGVRPAVVLVFHGYGRDHHRAWRYGQFLHPAGYSVMTVDFRSSRRERRLPTTLGLHELADVEATLAWARARPEWAGARLVLLGESLGASVALVAAARTPAVAAVVADCPFASGRRALEDTMHRLFQLPPQPAADVVRSLARTVTGHDPAALDVVAAADSLRGTPLLLIHAERDNRMSPRQARDIRAAAGDKDEIWLIPEGHNEGWQHHRAEYERRVLDFLERALAAPPAPLAGPAAPAGAGGV